MSLFSLVYKLLPRVADLFSRSRVVPQCSALKRKQGFLHFTSVLGAYRV
jgi:hypothetical protein